MNYFKNDKNEVFAYDDKQIEQGYGEDLEFITDAQVRSFKLFGIWDKTEQEILDEENRLEIQIQQKAFNGAIQNHLDTKAQSLRYDNINAIGKYVGYINDFQSEAEALGAWASSCWVVAGQIEVDVQSGTRPMPTVDEVLAELPTY